MPRARAGGARALAALAAGALAWRAARTAFAGLPLREVALAGALLAGEAGPSGLADPARSPLAYDLGASSVQLAKDVAYGGKTGGGLDGTYEEKGTAKLKDFVDSEKAIAQDQKFEEKFDQYIGVFAILFVGAFIAPMVTYFWYVRDTDPFENCAGPVVNFAPPAHSFDVFSLGVLALHLLLGKTEARSRLEVLRDDRHAWAANMANTASLGLPVELVWRMLGEPSTRPSPSEVLAAMSEPVAPDVPAVARSRSRSADRRRRERRQRWQLASSGSGGSAAPLPASALVPGASASTASAAAAPAAPAAAPAAAAPAALPPAAAPAAAAAPRGGAAAAPAAAAPARAPGGAAAVCSGAAAAWQAQEDGVDSPPLPLLPPAVEPPAAGAQRAAAQAPGAAERGAQTGPEPPPPGPRPPARRARFDPIELQMGDRVGAQTVAKMRQCMDGARADQTSSNDALASRVKYCRVSHTRDRSVMKCGASIKKGTPPKNHQERLLQLALDGLEDL
ncbi:unnamed protein product [Prorocentrum cordatum]|uniref:Uncharacterized protein n=1 Tax=Prorocentrum cordatum TaxID=2364126 RepID=A0ABN9U830_9DINO|nr:unnamed protein product [Polarella glacialis]